MTAIMSPPTANPFIPTFHSASAPRSGILLNASPSSSAPNSPKRTPYLLTPYPSKSVYAMLSHSSASSSTSSTDDITSSTSGNSSGGPTTSNSPAFPQQSHQHSGRKIRFAPLPEPRRDEYDELLQPRFFAEVDSAASSPKFVGSNNLPLPATPQIIPPTPTRLSSSDLLDVSHAASSCSTLGLSFEGIDTPDMGQATETGTTASSDCGTDETATAAKKKSPRWARLLRLPKPVPFVSGAIRSPDEYGQFHLFRSSSRESAASACSLRGGSVSDSNASTASLGGPFSRRKSAGADGASLPLFSFRGGFSLKPVVSEAGTASSPAVKKCHAYSNSAPSTVRRGPARGTRLLNGRVYGSRLNNSSKLAENPFANVRDTEPEFVEWGHGGMGSVRGARAAGGSGAWAALQSNQKLSVGHVADAAGREGEQPEDEDDGSGMGWVKRRREQREREKQEREEREAKEREEKERREKEEGKYVNGEAEAEDSEVEEVDAQKAKEIERVLPGASEDAAETAPVVQESCTAPAAEVPGPAAPADASEEQESREEGETRTIGMELKEAESASEKAPQLEPEHITKAVTVPALRPKVHHHYTHPFSSHTSYTSLVTPAQSTLPSAAGTPTCSAAILGLDPSLLAADVGGETGSSTPTSTSSSGFDDDEDEDEGASKDRAEDDDDDDDAEEGVEENDQTRKTAIGAGVEKISRHHKD